MIRTVPNLAWIGNPRQIGAALYASATDMEGATDGTKIVAPNMVNRHPGIAKAWALFTATAGISASHNVSAVVRNASGDFTISFTTAFSSASYCPHVSVDLSSVQARIPNIRARTASDCQINIVEPSVGLNDANVDFVTLVVYGDQ